MIATAYAVGGRQKAVGGQIVDYPGVLIADSSGNLFCVANGPTLSSDSLFEIPAGTRTIRDVLSFNLATGIHVSSLLADSDGNIYGVAFNGGAHGAGAVFEVAKGSTTVIDIASFNGADGFGPVSLVREIPSARC